MSERRLQSGRILVSEQPRKHKDPKEKVVNESKSANIAATVELLQEIKSMRTDLKGHITKLGSELKDFQSNTNERPERLLKNESILSQSRTQGRPQGLSQRQELKGDVKRMKESLNFVNINTEEVESLRKSNEKLKKKGRKSGTVF